jgi:hypothetical protein
VLVWSASLASCACPFLYEAVALVAKGEDGRHVPFLFSHVRPAFHISPRLTFPQ